MPKKAKHKSQYDVLYKVIRGPRKPPDMVKQVDGETWIPFGEVIKLVGRSRHAIMRWYEWWESLSEDERSTVVCALPECRQDIIANGTRYWRESDVPKLIQFRDSIERGQFHGFSSKWRGDKKD